MNIAQTKLLLATCAGLLIAAAAVFAVSSAQADEVPADGYSVVCPNEKLLDKLVFGEFTKEHSVCSLVLFAEVELVLPVKVLFGDSYDAWLSGLVDLPTETLPEVGYLYMKFEGRKLHALWPLWFLDEHWTDEETFAENAITFGVQTDKFEQWTPFINGLPDQPTVIASLL